MGTRIDCEYCRHAHLHPSRYPCYFCSGFIHFQPRDKSVSEVPKQEPKEGEKILGTACKAIIVDEFATSLPAPSYYSRFSIQPLDFIAANKLDFLTGNIIKYVMRHDAKNGLGDLQKARVYLDRLIQQVKEKGTDA